MVNDWWYEGAYYKTKKGIQNEKDGEVERDFIKGGYVEAKAGLYKDVLSFDVESLYPHMIIQYNISPETKKALPGFSEGLIKSEINEVYYKKEFGIFTIYCKKDF